MTPVPGEAGRKQNAPATEFSDHLMRNRIFMQRHFLHRLARSFGRLANRFRHFIRLAETDSQLCRRDRPPQSTR